MGQKNATRRRQQDIVVQELDGELLIYDLRSNKAFCLNSTAALVWEACDGDKDISQINDFVARKLNTESSDDLVWLALDQLKKGNLIENAPENGNLNSGLSRRDVIKKIGLTSMVALPVIASLVAPTSALASASCICVVATDCTGMTTCPSTVNCNMSGQCAP